MSHKLHTPNISNTSSVPQMLYLYLQVHIIWSSRGASWTQVPHLSFYAHHLLFHHATISYYNTNNCTHSIRSSQRQSWNLTLRLLFSFICHVSCPSQRGIDRICGDLHHNQIPHAALHPARLPPPIGTASKSTSMRYLEQVALSPRRWNILFAHTSRVAPRLVPALWSSMTMSSPSYREWSDWQENKRRMGFSSNQSDV